MAAAATGSVDPMTDTLRDDNRLFVALDLPDDLRRHLGELAERLAGEHGGRAVPAENLHATLSFLGRVTPSRVPEITTELAQSAPSATIPARLDALRARPGGRASVIAAQIELESADDAAVLDRLRVAVGEIADVSGGSELERPIWLHVTLVRFGRPSPIANLPDVQWEQVFAFTGITLYDSHQRTAEPPRFEPVATVALETPA